MNCSGDSIGPMAGFYKVPATDLVVVHDDLDLPFGAVRVKVGGGHGGHNGLRDLKQKLGNGDFVRVRMGVGRPPGGWDAADWVLSRFSGDETGKVPDFVDRGVDAVEAVLSDGVREAMSRLNGTGPTNRQRGKKMRGEADEAVSSEENE